MLEPEPPEGLETTAVTVTNVPSEPVDVNVVRLCVCVCVCELRLVVLVVSLVTKELVEEEVVCVGWLLDAVFCNEEEATSLLDSDDDVLKLEDGVAEEEKEEDVDDVVAELMLEVLEDVEVILEEVVDTVVLDDEVVVDEAEVVEVVVLGSDCWARI